MRGGVLLVWSDRRTDRQIDKRRCITFQCLRVGGVGEGG